MASPTAIAAYLLLFVAIAIVFLFVNLLVGHFVRPNAPHTEKNEVYECGEPAIGSSFVQFDLRYYVVALVFIVFDAEVAFLFPVATVFGKQAQLADARLELVEHPSSGAVVSGASPQRAVAKTSGAVSADKTNLTAAAKGLFQELGVVAPQIDSRPRHRADSQVKQLRQTISQFTLYVYAATLFFFLVLFIGFAYEWKTGAFDWVRAVTRTRNPSVATTDLSGGGVGSGGGIGKSG